VNDSASSGGQESGIGRMGQGVPVDVMSLAGKWAINDRSTPPALSPIPRPPEIASRACRVDRAGATAVTPAVLQIRRTALKT